MDSYLIVKLSQIFQPLCHKRIFWLLEKQTYSLSNTKIPHKIITSTKIGFVFFCWIMSPVFVHVPSHSGVILQIVLSSCSIFFFNLACFGLIKQLFLPSAMILQERIHNECFFPKWTADEPVWGISVALAMRQFWGICYIPKAAV